MDRIREKCRPKAWARALGVCTLATLLAACQTNPPLADSQLRDLCRDLGWASYVVGEYKARGDSRSQQVRWANRDVPSDKARHATLRIIHFAYAHDLDPVDLGTGIIRSCRRHDEASIEIDLDALL